MFIIFLPSCSSWGTNNSCFWSPLISIFNWCFLIDEFDWSDCPRGGTSGGAGSGGGSSSASIIKINFHLI